MQYTTWNSNMIDVNHLASTGRQVSLYTDNKDGDYGQMPPVPDGNPWQTAAMVAPPAVMAVMTLVLSMACGASNTDGMFPPPEVCVVTPLVRLLVLVPLLMAAATLAAAWASSEMSLKTVMV